MWFGEVGVYAIRKRLLCEMRFYPFKVIFNIQKLEKPRKLRKTDFYWIVLFPDVAFNLTLCGLNLTSGKVTCCEPRWVQIDRCEVRWATQVNIFHSMIFHLPSKRIVFLQLLPNCEMCQTISYYTGNKKHVKSYIFKKHVMRFSFYYDPGTLKVTPWCHGYEDLQEERFITWKGVCAIMFNTPNHEVASVLNRITHTPFHVINLS